VTGVKLFTSIRYGVVAGAGVGIVGGVGNVTFTVGADGEGAVTPFILKYQKAPAAIRRTRIITAIAHPPPELSPVVGLFMIVAIGM
jgi:hypothetical protein